MSMPDKWEYPWFAAWDLAFHCVALAHVDPAFAKYQLILLCREWFQHPERRAARLRVGLRRREPAGPGLGRAGGVRHRRRPRPRLPQPDLRQAAGQLHLVGQPGGRRGQQPVRGRLPRPGQHRPDRPLASARRRHPGAVRRHRLDGLLTRWRWPPSPPSCTGPATGPAPIWCSSSSSTSPRIRGAMDSRGLWDETDGLYYDRLVDPVRRAGCRSRSARWSGSSRRWRPWSIEEEMLPR